MIPSEAELQSIVTMEALASGLPAVGTNKDALPELIHHGENGYLFEPGNSLDLAEKIINILSNDEKKKEMSKESLRIIQKHDMEKVITEFEEVYKETLDSKSI